jgi:ribA/ribD-fused uncharacterized protein
LDGQAVYTLLAGKDRYILRSSGKTFAQIDKKYIDDGSWKNEFGQRIDVLLETIDKPMPEFLVPFDRMIELFAEIGFELQETKTFRDLYTAQTGIALDAAQQEYSFLHRAFAFKRKAEPEPVSEPVSETEVDDDEDGEDDEEENIIEEKAPKVVTLKVPTIAAPAEDEQPVFFFSKNPENKEFTTMYDTVFSIDDVEYKSAEHAYQAFKAKTFGDEDSFKKIVKAKSGQSAKSFGKKVTGFDAAVWDAKKDDIMKTVLRAKFSQNPAIRKLLLDTGVRILAEANPRDTYWGIGTSAGTTVAKNPAKWKGQNKLGKFLMELRDELRAEDAADEAAAEEEE